MKARSTELLERSIAAMSAAVEIYNKPAFPYRAESFAILDVNAWELLFKAKILKDGKNDIRLLYCYETRTGKNGGKTKKRYIKRTRSKLPFTSSIDYLAKKLFDSGLIEKAVYDNISLVGDYRDSSVHFVSQSAELVQKMQELGMASLQNYVILLKKWFGRTLSEFDCLLMPLTFGDLPRMFQSQVTAEEHRFLEHFNKIANATENQDSQFRVSVNVEIKFVRVSDPAAIPFTFSNSPDALPIHLSEEQIREKYPMSYDELTSVLRNRYLDFKVDGKYHALRKELMLNSRFGTIRYLDPTKPKGIKKPYFSRAIISEFDKWYTQKGAAT